MASRLVFFIDSPITKDSFGINKILFNIFHYFENKSLMCIAPEDSSLPSEYLFKTATYKSKLLSTFPKSLAFLWNSLANWINLSVIRSTLSLPVAQLKEYSPSLAVICGNKLETFIAGYYLSKKLKIPYIVYSMDDWGAHDCKRIFIKSGKDFLKKFLTDSAGLVTISEELRELYEERYDYNATNKLVFQNIITKQDLEYKKKEREEVLTIGYAGSIWGMHRDALEKFADAITHINAQSVKIKLNIHTKREFADIFRSKMLEWRGVEFCPVIEFEDLYGELSKYDLLLIVSSFKRENESLARCSLQTKLIDYGACGRPIISYGPLTSASTKFVEKWGCGYLICEQDIELLASEISVKIIDREDREKKGYMGFKIVKENFTGEVYANTFKSFLQQISFMNRQDN